MMGKVVALIKKKSKAYQIVKGKGKKTTAIRGIKTVSTKKTPTKEFTPANKERSIFLAKDKPLAKVPPRTMVVSSSCSSDDGEGYIFKRAPV